MSAPFHRPALVLCGALATLAAGCGNGGLGDKPSTPLMDELGHGQCPGSTTGSQCRLCDITGAATWEIKPPKNMAGSNCPLPPNQAVIVSGVTVVAIDTFDETHDGKSAGDVYVEDTSCGGMPYSGIEVFNPGFSPPGLRLAEGDVVDMNGLDEEFVGPSSGNFDDCHTLPEFTGTLAFRFDSIGLPEPVELTTADLVGYDNARPYLGMLVTVKNVSVTTAGSASSGRFTVPINVGAVSQSDVPYIDNELYDMQTDGPTFAPGTTFASVTGILTYFYQFHISPRSPADLVTAEPDGGAPDGGM